MTKCRRCSECEGRSHHWIADPMDPDDAEWEPGDHGCKHCSQRGDGCDRCAGDGQLFNDDNGYDDDAPLCPDCRGEGVVPISEQDYDREMYLAACRWSDSRSKEQRT